MLTSQSSVSGRTATFEDDGTSAWLYLSEPNTQRPTVDAWVYNRISAPPTSEIKNYRGGPPPAAIGYASDNAICESPQDHEWAFLWCADGEAVAITRDGEPVAFAVAEPKYSCSRELIKDGPWGSAWSQEMFEQTFGPAK